MLDGGECPLMECWWSISSSASSCRVKSPVDGMSLEGVESVPVHNATDYVGERFAIRWTEVFFLQTESGSSRWEPVDLSRVAETLATAVCIALTPHLQKLKDAGLVKIGLRVTLQPDSVSQVFVCACVFVIWIKSCKKGVFSCLTVLEQGTKIDWLLMTIWH